MLFKCHQVNVIGTQASIVIKIIIVIDIKVMILLWAFNFPLLYARNTSKRISLCITF